MTIGERFSRSWEITKLTFSIMTKEKELFVFPILSALFSIIFIILLIFPTIIIVLLKGNSVLWGAQWLLLFVIYFGLAFIAVFFNVCVVYTAASAFNKKGAYFWSTIKFALSRIHVIILWSLVSATVGLILRMIEGAARKARGLGGLFMSAIVWLVGMAWSIATIFVVQSLVYKDLKPFAAIKDSVIALKKTWGELLIKSIGIGIVQSLFVGLGLLIMIPLVVIGIFSGSPILVLIGVVLFILYIIPVSLFFSVANQIFNTALYVYAQRKVVVGPYTKEMMVNAFQQQKKKISLI